MATDRRSPVRYSVDVHLDDLQSEQEAGARTLERIRGDVSRLDSIMNAQLRHAALAGSLTRNIIELKRSTEQQRAMVELLRREMQKLRAGKKSDPNP